MSDDLELAHQLLDAGVPVFVAPPNSQFDETITDSKDTRSKEFFLPSGWHNTVVDPTVLDRWQPGWAVCMVTGHGFDAVDVDTKNGAVVAEQVNALAHLDVTVLGRVETPSGGAHLYVTSTGICSSSRPDRGVDYRGRGRDGSGAGFVYLPGTSRPRYDGAGYTVTTSPVATIDVDLDGQHDGIGAYLTGLGIKVRTRKDTTSVPVDGDPVDPGTLPPRLRDLLADLGPTWPKADGTSTDDRSARFHHLIGECRRARYTQGQTVTLLDPWCHGVGKFANRVEAEVARSWGKVETFAAFTVVETIAGSCDPDRWVDRKDGLLAADLAADVAKDAPLRRDLGDGIWAYVGGVWRPDRTNWVRNAVTTRLGNRSRPANTTAVLHYLLGQVPIIEPEPVPQYLNVKNGLLDWSTGQLLPHTPEVLSTVQLDAIWNPDATCPTVSEWLGQVLPEDLLEPTHDGPGFVWELLGYLCLSGNPLHKAVLLLGSGRNGKGTLLRLLTALLGTENVSSVDLHSLVTNRFRAAELLGKAANIAGDLDSSWLESTAVFKAITGGDRIPAERKFGQPFDFAPFAVPVYSANKVFGTPDTTDGYLSRWVVVPFPNTFFGEEDRDLDGRLQQRGEIDGLLVRAVEGLRAVLARGNFTTPPSVADAFDRFADESDPVRGFMRDVSRPHVDGWVTRDQLWPVYTAWAEDNGHTRKLPRAKLFAGLEAAGWQQVKRRGTRGFAGRTLTVEVVADLHSRHLEAHPAEQDVGAQGAEGAGPSTSAPAYGGEGREPAPSAPPAPERDHFTELGRAAFAEHAGVAR